MVTLLWFLRDLMRWAQLQKNLTCTCLAIQYGNIELIYYFNAYGVHKTQDFENKPEG